MVASTDGEVRDRARVVRIIDLETENARLRVNPTPEDTIRVRQLRQQLAQAGDNVHPDTVTAMINMHDQDLRESLEREHRAREQQMRENQERTHTERLEEFRAEADRRLEIRIRDSWSQNERLTMEN